MKKILYLLIFFGSYIAAQSPNLLSFELESSEVTHELSYSVNGTPRLSNFHITNSNPDRVYFNSSEIISATTATGFIVSGKSVSGITINPGQITDHYITVSSAFNFWDNNTIRYEGGSNIQDADSNGVYNFTLQYIYNNIIEPTSAENRYITVSGAGVHNGTPGNEWTIEEGFLNAIAGQTVWIKSGNYGSANPIVANIGTATNPIKFIGYSNTIGDNPSLTRSIGMDFDAGIMPLLENGIGDGINCYAKKYIIIRNIQVQNYTEPEGYTHGIQLDGSGFVIVDNVFVKGSNTCMGIRTKDETNSKNIRVVNSYVADCFQAGVRVVNDNNLIDNVWVVSSKNVGNGGMDYYIGVNGGSDSNSGNSIVRNCYINRYFDDSHTGHGISVKVGQPDWSLEYTLVENCEIINTKQSLEARHHNAAYGVYRNCTIYGDSPDQKDSGGIKILNGAHHNTFENISVKWAKVGIGYMPNGERPEAPDTGHDNIFMNCTFQDVLWGIWITEDRDDQGRVPYNNYVYNCVFDNSNIFINAESNDLTANTNFIINTIISDSGDDELHTNEHSFDFSYCDFYNNKSFVIPKGTGNIEINPQFTDAANGDFTLSAKTPVSVSDGGLDLILVPYDKEGTERIKNKYSIGAYENAINP